MSFTRFRTMNQTTVVSGTSKTYGGSPVQATREVGYYHSCSDDPGHYPEVTDFLKVLDHTSTAVMDGEYYVSGNLYHQAVNLRVSYWPSMPTPAAHFGGVLSDVGVGDAFAVSLCAKSNPNTSKLSLPTFIGELKDIPGLVKNRTKIIGRADSWEDFVRLSNPHREPIQKAARRYLLYRWGIRPLVQDLLTMFTAQKWIEERLAWLRKLQQDGELRRNVTLSRTVDDSGWSSVGIQNPAPFQVGAREKTVYSEHTWGSVRWKLDPGFELPPEDEALNGQLRKLARRLVFGWKAWDVVRAVWELTPYSWLADWFTTVGDNIAAADRTVPVLPYDVCVMRHSRGQHFWSDWDNSPSPWVTVSGDHYQEREVKERYVWVPNPYPTFKVPYLTGKHWSILVALLASRNRNSPNPQNRYWRNLVREWRKAPLYDD